MTGLSLSAHKPDFGQLVTQIAASRWTPVAVNLTALALLSYSLAQWSWQLLLPKATPPPAAAVPSPAQDSAAVLRELLAANLFGVVAPGQGGLTPDALPLTSLNLVLTGVMVRGKDSFALIKIDGREEEPVMVGQEITAGAKLHAVYADRVVLSRNGRYEGLILKESGAALAPGAIVSGAPRAANLGGIVRGSGNQFTVNRESMLQQMQRPEFLSQAMVVPNAGGGFLVREIQAGGLYEKLGVRVGDVIRSVNGQPINTMDDVMKIYQQLGGLQNASNVSIEVTRAGRSENLNYRLD
jgi:general secretion pathway protein C